VLALLPSEDYGHDEEDRDQDSQQDDEEEEDDYDDYPGDEAQDNGNGDQEYDGGGGPGDYHDDSGNSDDDEDPPDVFETLQDDFDGWTEARGLGSRNMNTLNLDAPVNAAEDLIYGPVMCIPRRRELAHCAFHDCGLAEYLSTMGASIPSTYNAFGCNDVGISDLSLAAILAQDFLTYGPYSLGEFQKVFNFCELQACTIAMANILPAFQRLICQEDDEALLRQEEREKYDTVVGTLLEVLQRNNGISFSGAMPEALTDLREVAAQESFGSNGADLELDAEVSLRLLFQLVYFVGSRFL